MKKNILYSMLFAVVALLVTSCGDKESEGLSRFTYYPVLELEGDEMLLVPIGTSFVDPGVTATLAGEDISSQVNVSGADQVNVNSVGFYDITYSAISDDGFPASISRTVVVYDPSVTATIAGTYSTDMTESLYGTTKDPFSARAAGYGNTSQCVGIEFTEFVPGIFAVNDLFGGWYAQIRAYDAARYSMTGYVCLNPDNTITLLSSYVRGWGNGLDYR